MQIETRGEYLFFLSVQQAWLYAQPQEVQDEVCNGIGSQANWLYRQFNFKGWLYRLIKPAVDKHDIAFCCGGNETQEGWANDNLEKELEEVVDTYWYLRLARDWINRQIDRIVTGIRVLGRAAWEYREEPITIEEYLAKKREAQS